MQKLEMREIYTDLTVGSEDVPYAKRQWSKAKFHTHKPSE